jgi:hypothetical protein
MNTSTSCSRPSPTRTAGARISFVSFHTQRPILTALPCFVDIPNRGSSDPRYCSTGTTCGLAGCCACPHLFGAEAGNGALTRGDLNAEHGLRARILARLAGWDETDRKRSGCKGDRCGDRAAPLSGCAGLHLDQGPTRSSNGPRMRTITPRNRRPARSPPACCPTPYLRNNHTTPRSTRLTGSRRAPVPASPTTQELRRARRRPTRGPLAR